MAMQRTFALSLAFLVACAGCVSYTPTAAPIPQAGSMPAWNTGGAVSVGADPYTQPARQATVFGGNLQAAGVIPIQVFVQNREERRLVIRPSDMVLALPDGSQMNATGAGAAAAKLEGGAGTTAVAMAFGCAGAMAEEKTRAVRQEDYRRKELQDTNLRKDESTHGFVYFIPPVGTPAFTEATLVVRLVDVAEATSFVVRLPLTGVGFQGTPPKAK